MTARHRYAAHYLYTPSSGYLKRYGVEMEGERLVRIFPVDGEMERTEWLPGVIRLEWSAKGRRWEVWHDYPFNFAEMKPAAGTRRRRLP